MDIDVKPTVITRSSVHTAGPEATNPFETMWCVQKYSTWHRYTVLSIEKGLRCFHVDNVGLCVSAVEMVIGLTGKAKQEAQLIILNLLKPATAASKREAAEALLSRRHIVSGFDNPTPLVTFQEGMQLVRLLPPKH
eukprot:2765137-Rhodomonas_salina.1